MVNVLEIPYVLLSADQLDQQDLELLKVAEEMLETAHAPYSHFRVGSAVLLEDGSIYGGNNQENAAYPSGLCAERVALFKAKSESQSPIRTILVIARNANDEPADAFACGGCRQVMMEYAACQKHQVRVLMRNKAGAFIEVKDVQLLLPFHFEARTLK